MPKTPSMSEQLAAKVALLNQIEELANSEDAAMHPRFTLAAIRKLLKGDKPNE